MLASCANLIGPHEVDLPLTRLQQNLDRHFPINHRVLEVFDIQLSQPQLTILPDSGRVSLTMATALSSPLLRQSRSGSLAFSGNLFLDTVRNAVFIRDARVDRFVIDGIDEARQRQLAVAASIVTDQIMNSMPLYSFHPEELHYAGVQFMPTKITTMPNALAVTIEPVK
ncbi:MAG TPA: DUF1439 domain-containing protein [Burkholderiaceae bacterium]